MTTHPKIIPECAAKFAIIEGKLESIENAIEENKEMREILIRLEERIKIMAEDIASVKKCVYGNGVGLNSKITALGTLVIVMGVFLIGKGVEWVYRLFLGF
jgi:hypothetical protein